MQNEPLLQDNKDRFVIFPVKHHDIWDFYQQLKKAFYTPFPEDPLDKEHRDWQNLNASEKEFLPYFLNFFSAATGKMSFGLTLPLLNSVKNLEAAAFLRLQSALENRQSEATAGIAQRMNSGATENFHSALQKQEKWLESFQNLNFAEQLLAASFIKMMFSADVFLLKEELQKRKVLPQFRDFLGKISNEIQLVSHFYRFLHDRHVLQQVSENGINEIVSEVLLLEKQISTELPATGAFGITAKKKDAFLNLLAEKFISGNEKPLTNPSEKEKKSALAEKRAGTLNKNPEKKESQQKSGPEK